MSRFDFLDFAADLEAPAFVNTYDELPVWSALFGVLLLDEVPLSGVRRVLDVGCGTGFPLIELAGRLGPGCEIHGVDVWRAGLRRASDKIAARKLQNVSVHEADASQLPFDDGYFDLVVSNLGLNNFEDRAGALREARRVLRRNGILALTTNLQGHMKELYDVFETVLQRIGDPAAVARLHRHVAHRATVPRVRNLLSAGGFATRRVAERAGWMRFANGTALMNHHFVKLGFLDGWRQVVPARERTVFGELLDALDAYADERGELRLTVPIAYIEGEAREHSGHHSGTS